jgi:hypothetical protein
MNASATLTQKGLLDFLLHVAPTRPVFIWGPPGVGKSALVQKFATSVGLDCVSLLGSQLAPEDLIGVPQIVDGTSRFCPPAMIARTKPYCLFLDELNACSQEVQKAFYSLIHERRIGEYHLPEGSVIVAAGNRSQDSTIVKPMSSALLNRMVHVHLRVSPRDWLEWAEDEALHPWVTDYIKQRPDHLWSQPPKHEEPFSSPRSWHLLSDALFEYQGAPPPEVFEVLAYGTLTPAHATSFKAYFKQIEGKFNLNALIKGDQNWPDKPEDRDVLYFLTQSFRAQLIKELPQDARSLKSEQRDLVQRAKVLLKDLAHLSLELAQTVVAEGATQDQLPSWFLVEVVRDLPKLAAKDHGQEKR